MFWDITLPELLVHKGDVPEYNDEVLFMDWDDTIVSPVDVKMFIYRLKEKWKWTFDNVIEKLSNYPGIIVFFSNQSKASYDNDKGLSHQIEDVVQHIQFKRNFWFFGALKRDYVFRKPSSGMFQEFCRLTSWKPTYTPLFVGDAAGRYGDHSSVDRHLADNLGFCYKVPDEFFLGQEVILPEEEWAPYNIDSANEVIPTVPADISIILLHGAPASGKTTFANKLSGYKILNQNEIGTLPKLLKQARLDLAQHRRIIIDKEHPTRESRLVFIELAREFHVKIGLIHIWTPNAICNHLNHYRAMINGIKPVAEITIKTFWKKYEKPILNEGFDWIEKYDFVSTNDDPNYVKWLS